jgi:hypothetical protein
LKQSSEQFLLGLERCLRSSNAKGSALDVTFNTIYGVDFSGAKLAGRNLWVARLERRVNGGSKTRPYALAELQCIETLCGTAERSAALGHLVGLIRASDGALWAMDFPFGLPVEVLERGTRWPQQIEFLRGWGEDAYGIGLECLARARRLGGPLHIRRLTDVEAKAPFDCYHYRMIYMFFYGLRDVLGPLAATRGTAVLPFQYRRLPSARRVIVEACPSSTLKRLGLPHQNYKQPAGGPLTPRRRRTRRTILDAVERNVLIDSRQCRTMMRNGGGDALDAVLAAFGGEQAWRFAGHAGIARHVRYSREGYLYC